MKTLILVILLLSSLAHATSYPEHWWKPVPRSEAASWETLPQEAKSGEVILSKRNELGVFSNFAATPFCLDDKCYASIEGLWQSMKYPDPALPQDPRHRIQGWPHTRAEVEQMVSFVAKDAGDVASAIYKQHNLKEISYGEKFFNHKDYADGSLYHYRIIKAAAIAKLAQNPEAYQLLLTTKGLILKPDHHVGDNDPPAYRYYQIMMEIRDQEILGPSNEN
jgi:predicted NAD-dependent protein-ADP-ribosyltransferase YbiA (DUF1768 family)